MRSEQSAPRQTLAPEFYGGDFCQPRFGCWGTLGLSGDLHDAQLFEFSRPLQCGPAAFTGCSKDRFETTVGSFVSPSSNRLHKKRTQQTLS
eukprot:4513277-Amphidinium_carterae.1